MVDHFVDLGLVFTDLIVIDDRNALLYAELDKVERTGLQTAQ